LEQEPADIVQLGGQLTSGDGVASRSFLQVLFARGENISLSSVNQTMFLQLLSHGKIPDKSRRSDAKY
jgi:hypothetical protein